MKKISTRNRGKGFASMPHERRREIASLGGRRAHEMGFAHEWSAEEASVAGRKGGLASAAVRRARAQAQAQVVLAQLIMENERDA